MKSLALFSCNIKRNRTFLFFFFCDKNFPRSAEKLRGTRTRVALLCRRYLCIWRWRSLHTAIEKERAGARETETRLTLYTCLVSWIFVFRINSARSNGCHGGPEIASRASPTLQLAVAVQLSERIVPSGTYRIIVILTHVISPLMKLGKREGKHGIIIIPHSSLMIKNFLLLRRHSRGD